MASENGRFSNVPMQLFRKRPTSSLIPECPNASSSTKFISFPFCEYKKPDIAELRRRLLVALGGARCLNLPRHLPHFVCRHGPVLLALPSAGNCRRHR